MARNAFIKAGRNLVCEMCNYSKIVHICHINDISLFDESTPISKINSQDNLRALCPNHHWEFDNDK